jgi:hypothetical protein
MFELRHYQPWTFAAFAIVLLQTILTYMLAGLVFPDLFGEGIVDLRESFYAHRVWFFALGFFVILVSICKVACSTASCLARPISHFTHSSGRAFSSGR